MHPDAAPVRTEPSGAGDADGAAGTPETDRARRTVPPPRSAPESTPASGTADPDGTSAVPGDTTHDGSTAEPSAGLTDRERDILDFEQQWWRHAGAKEQAIRDRFDLSATRYYQLLNGLLDNPAALAAEPLLVGRLRRLRSSRARNRRR